MQEINAFLVEYGFVASSADPCLYIMIGDEGALILLLCVGDLAIISNNLALVTMFKQAIAKEFEMTDMGELTYMLGVEIIRDRANRTLEMRQQTGYFDQLTTRFGLNDVHPRTTPMDFTAGVPPRVTIEAGGTANPNYRSVVGGGMYGGLFTRPDIAFSMQALGRNLQCLMTATWRQPSMCSSITLYPKGTRGLGIKFGPGAGGRDALTGGLFRCRLQSHGPAMWPPGALQCLCLHVWWCMRVMAQQASAYRVPTAASSSAFKALLCRVGI